MDFNLNDIKKSIVENLKVKLPSIVHRFADPPQGTYERPCIYIDYRDKKISFEDSFFGMLKDAYTIGITIENRSDETYNAVETRSGQIDSLFYENEEITVYKFIGNKKLERYATLRVKQYRIVEGGKDREKNKIRADLIVIV